MSLRSISIAPTGQPAIQAPQPLHFSDVNCGSAGPPLRNCIFNASLSHCSAQTRHSTRRKARHCFSIRMACDQLLTSGCSACGMQAVAHSSQKSQPSAAKLISGKPPEPRLIIWEGQALMQSSQRVHRATNCSSEIAPGGRRGEFERGRPVRNARLEVGAERVASIGIYPAITEPRSAKWLHRLDPHPQS